MLADADDAIVGFGDWAEQLIAESTGKQSKGILPVVVEDPSAPGYLGAGPDALLASTGTAPGADVTVTGPLGAQFLLWEYATAVAGYVLEINPFDQPNVTESKDNTGRLLESAASGGLRVPAPLFADGPVQVFGDESLAGGVKSLDGGARRAPGRRPGPRLPRRHGLPRPGR